MALISCPLLGLSCNRGQNGTQKAGKAMKRLFNRINERIAQELSGREEGSTYAYGGGGLLLVVVVVVLLVLLLR